MSSNPSDAGLPELPPPYDEAAADGSQAKTDAEPLLPPTIYVLEGQSIHAESGASAALYRVNRGVATLSHATTEVEFERVERTVRARGEGGGPEVRPPRYRQVYALRHGLGAGVTSLDRRAARPGVPQYLAKAVSRAALGDVGLAMAPSLRARLHVGGGGGERWTAGHVADDGDGYPRFPKRARPLFEIRGAKNDSEPAFQWTDADGNAVAIEDEGEGQHRLIVTAALHRDTVDVLVALWCCRLWQHSADNQEPVHEGMAGVRRKLRLARESGVTSGGFYGA